jgi:hypothetical protein
MAGKKEAQATVTFTTWHEGFEVQVEKGERLPDSHPIVEGHREFFAPAALRSRAGTSSTATATKVKVT